MIPPLNTIRTILIAALSLPLTAMACHVEDNEPPMEPSDPDDEGGSDDCSELGSALQCSPGQQVFAMWEEGAEYDSTVITVDDPAAHELPSGGLLFRVLDADDFVGTELRSTSECIVGCGYCYLGESLCVAAIAEDGRPQGCTLCLPYDVADPEAQCVTFLAACG